MANTPPLGNRLPGRLPALDGVRGLAIGLVLAWHCLHQLLFKAAQPGTWAFHVYRWTNLAWSGVDLFFVLSGFLITKVILENRDSPRLLRTFYWRRACRILPLYYIVVGAVFLARYELPSSDLWRQLFGGQLPWQSYVTLTQNFAMGTANTYGGDALAVTWSLAVEEQFYLVLPIVIRFLPKRYLPWLFAAGIPWAYLVRMHFHNLNSYVLAPDHADSLLTGCLLAWICLQPAAYNWLKNQGRGLTLLLGFLAAGLALINQMPDYFNQTIPSWLTLFFGTLVLIAATQPNHPIAKLLEIRGLKFLGAISYGVYLFHFPMQNMLYWLLKGTTPEILIAGDLYLPVLVVTASIVAASLSWFLYEKHWVKLGHRLKF
jgi:peptidoglycan/LPS O-acetylase OafA/YrhL